MLRGLKKALMFLSTGQSPSGWQRLREKYDRSRSPFVRRLLAFRCERLLIRSGAFIPMSAQIDGRLNLPHGLNGIFISSGAVIGKNCTLFHQVTVGSNAQQDSLHPGAPVIGNDVYIGAGAKIIGGIRVGNNVRIGANCVVFEDVPDNATVVLPRPRVILHEGARSNDFAAFDAAKSQEL